jgi:4-hydroxybenzoate polyprenyltransferase
MSFTPVKNVIYLTRLHKPIGILLLLWPTLWALWLAKHGAPDWRIVSIFVVGVVLMRSAGCVINDIADRHVDKHVERTRDRPLTSGKLSLRAAWGVFFILLTAAFLLVLCLNRFALALSFIGAALAVIYPFMKRFTHLPQLGLGLAFAWGVPMAFAAETNAIPLPAWELFFAAALWPIIYDTMYAMVDRNDDVKIGIKSTAIFFGRYDRLVIGIMQIIFLLLLVDIGTRFDLTTYYFGSLFFAGLLFIYQQILLKSCDRAAYFKAFLNNHWVGMVIFLGILTGCVA